MNRKAKYLRVVLIAVLLVLVWSTGTGQLPLALTAFVYRERVYEPSKEIPRSLGLTQFHERPGARAESVNETIHEARE